MTNTRLPAAVAAAVSLTLGLTAWTWRTGAVGGSDSACYALMAKVFADGERQPVSPLALRAPWPDATRVAAPAGFLPSEFRPGAAVPVCAPGYSWMISPLVRVGGPEAVHVVPPIAAALLAWLTFGLARRLHSAWAGVCAVALVSSSPIVLFQAVQPMNDISTGALWMAVAVAACRARPARTGALAGAALLVRPNLALAAVAAVGVLVWLVADPPRPGWPARARGAAAVAALSALPGVIVALALNAALYGSPLSSGYGDLGVLFSWSHVPVNAVRYATTWIETNSPIVLLALVAPLVLPQPRRTTAWGCSVIATALCVVYLAYRPFDEWWYLRFLLPAVAIAAALAAAALTTVAERCSSRFGWAMALVVAAAVAVHGLERPEAREALRLRALEARFPLTAEVIASRLPADTVPITLWQSGGLRFWPGSEVVVWDALDPAWLDRAIEWLTAQGRSPVIVVERAEEDAFRRRFTGQRYGGLDWPPRYDVNRRVRIYLPEDRAPYFEGVAVATVTIVAAP